VKQRTWVPLPEESNCFVVSSTQPLTWILLHWSSVECSLPLSLSLSHWYVYTSSTPLSLLVIISLSRKSPIQRFLLLSFIPLCYLFCPPSPLHKTLPFNHHPQHALRQINNPNPTYLISVYLERFPPHRRSFDLKKLRGWPPMPVKRTLLIIFFLTSLFKLLRIFVIKNIVNKNLSFKI